MKLFACDIDGTYLPFSYDQDANFVPAGDNEAALRHRLEMGDAVVFASGRPFRGIEPLLKRLGNYKHLYAITSYGASLYRADGTRIRGVTVPSDMIHQLKNVFQDEKNTYLCYILTNELGYIGKLNFAEEEAKFTRTKLRNLEENPLQEGEEVEKALLTSHKHEAETMEIPDHLLTHTKAMATNDFFLEFVSKDASKADMIRDLAAELGVKNDEIYALGDSYNDLSMVKAFYGIVPSDGKDIVKEAAKMISIDSHDGAVAYALKQLGLY